MSAEREALAGRVRGALPHRSPVREVSMFGGLSFMVDDSMVLAAGGGGDLLGRPGPPEVRHPHRRDGPTR